MGNTYIVEFKLAGQLFRSVVPMFHKDAQLLADTLNECSLDELPDEEVAKVVFFHPLFTNKEL